MTIKKALDALDKAEKIKQTITEMGVLIPFLANMDLDLLLGEAGRMDAIGPLLDPTAYIKNGRTIQQNVIIAKAFQSARKKIEDELGQDVWKKIIRDGD